MNVVLYNENIKGAVRIAFKAHKEQVDKGGYPYIMHPLHLAEQMTTEDEVMVALLHDTVEDDKSGESALRILELDISEEALEAIDILTRKPNQTYKEYIKSIKGNELAKKIKIADIRHNLDVTRILNIKTCGEDTKDVYECTRHALRYVEALKELTEELNNGD